MERIYIPDSEVDDTMDKEIRNLLVCSFPSEKKFVARRYGNDKPRHRWLIKSGEKMAAHLAAHEKTMSYGNITLKFIGISEVCVHPEFRRQGLAGTLLKAVEDHFKDVKVFILLGKAMFYTSSGYVHVNNVYFSTEPGRPTESAMVKVQNGFVWPGGQQVLVFGMPF